jgi:[acyl-carrier-protein] S-malonyltransferase
MTPATAEVAAWVGGDPVPVAEVDARLAVARRSGFGARLPEPATAEGRNARRWIVQLLCAERLVRRELAARRIAVSGATRPLRVERALALGGVAAALSAAIPETEQLIDAAEHPVDDGTVREYYARNHDLFADRGITVEQARPDIVRTLSSAARDRALRDWVERRMADDVVLAHGFEHPSDPAQPDATHRH